MANSRIITYECEECGSEIVVTAAGEGQLSPIYCCGIEVTEVSTAKKKPAAKKKPVKKMAKKKVAAKQKPAAKKKKAKK
jgi:hypothetical protein